MKIGNFLFPDCRDPGRDGAVATTTRRSKIGFAVVQTALHHPIRLAEQLAVLDNVTKGRLLVGLGRGSSYNIYDYQGFGIDHHEAQERLEEAEEILLAAWTRDAFTHRGFDARTGRPRPPVSDECAMHDSDAAAR